MCHRTEEVERNSQLRTQAMREAEKRPNKTYRFTLIRVRFPDGFILQGIWFLSRYFVFKSIDLVQVLASLTVYFDWLGTFYSREKLRDVFEFVRQSLVSDWQPFVLSEATGQLTDENASLLDLGLVRSNPLLWRMLKVWPSAFTNV